ncbi:MAG TPA: phosphate ABC transporter substrate-binding protein PstS [Puia sp.]|jgi:phosphate transport system substrate-binding protein
MKLNSFKIKRSLVTGLFFMVVSASLVSCGSGGGSTSGSDSTASGNSDDNALIGAGSSFDNPLFSKQFSEYNKTSGLKVNYQSVGSGAGISQLTNKTVDFGASDAPMNGKQDSALSAPAIHIPITAGAVVLSYNLPEVKDTLMLSPAVLADIFLGKITKWNDAKIAAVNKGVKLPATSIVIAHRSDGSGTSNIFTTYLAKVSEEWSTKVGKGSSVNWPAGLGGKGNEGVAGLIKQTPGAIGYIELAYAIQNSMPYAKMQNKAGNFITPSIASVTAAANIQIPADSKVSLTNTDAVDGYPISGFSWVIIYKEQKYNNRSLDRATKLLKLLSWMIHDGQQFSGPLNYAPLSPAAVTTGDAILKSATYDGKPILQ